MSNTTCQWIHSIPTVWKFYELSAVTVGAELTTFWKLIWNSHINLRCQLSKQNEQQRETGSGSAHRSEGANVVELQAKAKQDFNDALYAFSDIASRHTKAAMLPENTPELMPTLVKLSEAAIKIVGYQAKDIIAYVKKALKDDPRFKKFWNKVSDQTYRKAAMQAAEQESATRVDDLFTMAERSQKDLFIQELAAPKEKTWEERKKGNYTEPEFAQIAPPDVAKRIIDLVNKWSGNLPEATISDEDRSKAEALLKPVIDAAKKDEPWFDSIVRAIGDEFLGSQLGPTKKVDRAAVKLVSEQFNVGEMKDIVRATIVVDQYDTSAQSALDAIGNKFEIIQINNKTALNIKAPSGAKIKNKGVSPEGYSDVTAFVRLPSGGIAEVQINIPEILSAKKYAHILYEGSRVVEGDPDRQEEYTELRDGQLDAYQAALNAALERRASATDLTKYASSELQPRETGLPGNATSSILSSSSLNQLPSGNLTNSSPPNDEKNLQPSGNLSGTFISTSDVSISKQDANSYTNDVEKSIGDKNEQQRETGSGSAQRQVAGTSQKPAAKRGAKPVSEGSSGNDLFGSGEPDATAADTAEVGQSGADGVRGQNENGGRAKSGSGAKRPAGIPAGRDDLTYMALNGWGHNWGHVVLLEFINQP